MLIARNSFEMFSFERPLKYYITESVPSIILAYHSPFRLPFHMFHLVFLVTPSYGYTLMSTFPSLPVVIRTE